MLKRDQLINIMIQVRTKNGKKFIPIKECSDRMIQNALKYYAAGCYKPDILGILDTSLTGNGKTGILLSVSTLYGRDFKFSNHKWGNVEKLPLNGICRMDIADNKNRDIIVSYRDGKKRTICVLESEWDAVWDLLNRILTAYTECGMIPDEKAAAQNDEERLKELLFKAEQGDKEAEYQYACLCYKMGDREKAFSWFKRSGLNGFADAQFICGQLYYTGNGVEKDHAKALIWYRKAAEQGHVDACYNAALMYENGIGEPQNMEMALYWYQKGAEQDHGEMQYKCGEIYRQNGNWEEALKWFEMAAHQGNSDAACRCGELYEEKSSIHMAFYWYQQAAKQGNTKAQCRCGEICEAGEADQTDPKEAFQWYRQAAKLKDWQGYFHCGTLYLKGIGVEKDREKALKYYKKAAVLSEDREKIFEIICDTAQAFQKKEQLSSAVQWYKSAADLGCAEAAFRCGKLYESGMGMAKSHLEAIHWYKIAANLGIEEAGERVHRLEAKKVNGHKHQERIYTIYKKNKIKKIMDPEKIKADFAEDLLEAARYLYSKGNDVHAFQFCKKAADEGNVEAAFRCGMFYAYGIGTKENSDNAFLWFRTAAGKDHIRSQFECGNCYFKGEGIRYDHEMALKWYKKAAEQGDECAQHMCGCMYAKADGTKRDLDQALYWYQCAVERRNVPPIHLEYSAEKRAEQRENWIQEMLAIANQLMNFKAEDTALKWYEAAGRAGSGTAQIKRGIMYMEGKGGPIDFYKARRWFKKAAEQQDHKIQQMAKAYLQKVDIH